MSPNAGPSSAIERARRAYDQMKRREHVAAARQRARERARNIALAATTGGAVALLIGLSIYNGWMPATLRSSAQDMRAEKRKEERPRTAQIRSFIKGNTCRELRFNNDSGTLVGANLLPCEMENKPEPLSPDTPEGARLNAIRDALKR
jgi:hypothetical protein